MTAPKHAKAQSRKLRKPRGKLDELFPPSADPPGAGAEGGKR